LHRRFFIAATAAALGSKPALSQRNPPVVASFSVLGDLAGQIGGRTMQIQTLVPADGDVHVYQPTPKDLRTIAQSRLLIRNGLGLEGWMDRLVSASGFNGTVVVAAEKVTPRTMKEAGGEITTDPHAWQNPDNAVLYVTAIAEGLSKVDPASADTDRAAADRLSGRIKTTSAWIEAQYAPIPCEKRRIITTHDAFGYYGDRYGIEFLAAEGISTEDEPSAKSIAALIAQIKREKIRAVFIENMTNPRLGQMLARETGATLGGTVYSDALSPPGGPAATYLDMLTHNARLFAAAMKG
jgi:zinc/manganese transport system substrate-binding protein